MIDVQTINNRFSPTEKVYEVAFDGDVFIINALSFGDAVKSWKGWMKQEYSSDYEESWEPESVAVRDNTYMCVIVRKESES